MTEAPRGSMAAINAAKIVVTKSGNVLKTCRDLEPGDILVIEDESAMRGEGSNVAQTGNATFHTFRPSGKWYATGRGLCPESAFSPMLAHHEPRVPILVANDGRMPGLSSDGDGYDVVVVLDEVVDFGWPLMLRAR